MHRRAVSKLAGVWAAVAGGGGVQEEEGLAGGGVERRCTCASSPRHAGP